MIEVYRERDYSTVALIQGILENNGIHTMMRNGNAVTMTTEVPIPVMFPNICVFNHQDAAAAHEIIHGYFTAPAQQTTTDDWTCPNCQQPNEAPFSECWSCQTERPTQ